MEWIFCAGLLFVCGCGEPENPVGSSVVARVGDHEITVEDYDRMAARLLDGPYRHVDWTAPEEREKLLEAMISKQLLIVEGQERGLDRNPEIASELAGLETRLLRKEIFDRLEPGIEEPARVDLEVFFYEAGFDDELRLFHIRCGSEAEAREILARLQTGASFERLVVEKVGQQANRLRAGDLGYVPAAHMLPEVEEQLLSLEIGQVYPEPLRTRFGIHVFRLVDRRSVDFESRRDLVAQEYAAEAHKKRFTAYQDSLKRAAGFSCDESLIERLDDAEPFGFAAFGTGAVDDDAMLCAWEGGAFTVAEYRSGAGQREKAFGAPPLSESVADAAGTKLVVAEARRMGYDRLPEVRERIRRLEEQLIADRLKEIVVGDVEIAEAAMQRFYDEHPELYGPRPTVKVLEILVAEREMAEQLRQRVDSGESLEELAREFNTREATRDEGGHMWLTRRENPLLGHLAPLALDAQVGTLHGPVEVPGGFSVFRVEERDEIEARSFAQVRRNIETVLQIKAAGERMDRFLAGLRKQRADIVQIFPEALELVLQGYEGRDSGGMAAAGSDESEGGGFKYFWE